MNSDLSFPYLVINYKKDTMVYNSFNDVWKAENTNELFLRRELEKKDCCKKYLKVGTFKSVLGDYGIIKECNKCKRVEFEN